MSTNDADTVGIGADSAMAATEKTADAIERAADRTTTRSSPRLWTRRRPAIPP
jgi:hypothetical protein